MNPLIQVEKICLVCVAVLACYGLSPALNANTIRVTNTNDSGPGSLRAALAVAFHGDTIDATGVSGRILLTSGALRINFFNNNVRIIGPGAGQLAVDGNATSPVFENYARGVTIAGFTITNGRGGGILNPGGASVWGNTWVELTVTRCSVVSNIGVGISNFANDPITQPQNASATLTITNSTVSGNRGGGISNIAAAGELDGAGAELTVSNCTISGNRASKGGGIYNSAGAVESNAIATVTISNSTLSSNSAVNGGGIYNISNGAPGGGLASVKLGSTILKTGSSGPNIVGGVISLGYNLASDNGGGFLRAGHGDQINTDPRLGPLQDNGGATFTHALLPGSPAINRGNPNFTPPPFYDQRGPGYHRVVNGRIDIGAFEVQ